MKKIIVSLVALAATFGLANAEGQFSYLAESNLVVGGGDYAPFWFVSNRQGLVSTRPQDFSLRMAFFKDYQKRENTSAFYWDYAYGLDLIGAYNGGINSLHQAYVKVKYGPFGVALGNFETVYGNQDYALSSGGFGWSGNSRPMPRFDISIPEFTAVPFTKGYVELKGVFSNGFFSDKNYVLDQKEPGWGYTYNTLLHHKNLYLRFGGKSIINYTLGVEHYVQWAGTNSKGKLLPLNLKEYWNVVCAFMPAGKDHPDGYIEGMEANNRYGDHMGQVNNRLDMKLKDYTISAYWQYFIDDASFRKLENISDGLWGLLWRSNKQQAVTGVLFEFLKTTNQSGLVHQTGPNGEDIHGGLDDYYNNSLFTSGWTYFGQTIGTPLISSSFYNKDHSLRLINNCVKAYHLGIDGYLSNTMRYKGLFTYSENFGRKGSAAFPEPLKNVSFLAEVSTKIKKWEGFELTTAVGGDFGKMYGNNFGVMLGLRKSGVF